MPKAVKFLLLVALVTLVVSLVGCRSASSGVAKIILVHIGPVNDFGWTYAHDQGARNSALKFGKLEVEAQPGKWVEITATTTHENIVGSPHYRVSKDGKTLFEISTVESVGPDNFYQVTKSAIKSHGEKAVKLVIATAENYRDDVNTLAKEFPQINFAVIHGDYEPQLANVASYFGKIYEAWYVAGTAAGALTKSGVATFVGAYQGNGQVETNIAAFARGFTDAFGPKAQMSVIYTGTWYDPVKERQAAEAHLKESDVIAAHQDSTEVGKVGVEEKMWTFGYDSDWRAALSQAGGSLGDSDYVATCPVWDWNLIYQPFIEASLKGEKIGGRWWPGLATGAVKLSPWSAKVPLAVQAKAEEAKQQIIAGSLKVFPKLSDEQIWGLSDWKSVQ